MKTTIQLDASNRIVLPLELRRAAGIPRNQRLSASATPGRIVLEVEPSATGRIVKRGKLKVWSGPVPKTPIEEAVEQVRHYSR
jgi:bifunctional DNA-binding transcriptional regulator/antitoxin component of YhaV-PrlF toxin-antitoxin module